MSKNNVDLLLVHYGQPMNWHDWKVRFEVHRFIQSLPGVETAVLAGHYPLSEGNRPLDSRSNLYVTVEGLPFSSPGDQLAQQRTVTPGYFSLLGIPLHHGRTFNESDTGESERVAIIKESFARRYWEDRDPVGCRITAHDANGL